MSIDAHIKDLLMEHDCVIVPEFGGFVSNYASSNINKVTHRISAPSKHISFNRNLLNNDGLLANRFVTEDGIAYDDALSSIREQVVEWKSKLDSGERIVIQGVGNVYADQAGKWRFTQSNDENLLMASFGLGSLKLQPIEAEVPAAKVVEAAPVVEKKTSIETPVVPLKTEEKNPAKAPAVRKNEKVRQLEPIKVESGGRKVKWYWVAAAACILPLAFYSYWIPSQTDALDRGYLTLSDLNPFTSGASTTSVYTDRKESIDLSVPEINIPEDQQTLTLETEDDGSRDYVVAEKRAAPPNVPADDAIPEPTPPAPTPTTAGSYHVITGCFRKSVYAENQVSELQAAGFGSYILDISNGLNRVCASSYTTKAEAQEAQAQLNAQGISSWVLTK